jgi:hypothetical protein
LFCLASPEWQRRATWVCTDLDDGSDPEELLSSGPSANLAMGLNVASTAEAFSVRPLLPLTGGDYIEVQAGALVTRVSQE